MNIQKIDTATSQNDQENEIVMRRCSEPTQNVQKIYNALNYKYAPFVRKKSAVHKSETKNLKNLKIKASHNHKCKMGNN